MSDSKPGPKPVQIDQSVVEALASRGMPWTEIHDYLGGRALCGLTTLKRQGRDAYRRGRSKLKKSLREKQIEVALKGDRTMLIWCGKQYLSQADKSEMKMDLPDPKELSDEQLMAVVAGKPPKKVLQLRKGA